MNSKDWFNNAESIEFSGRVIVAMAQDPNISRYSSKVLVGAEYAELHGIRDIDNRVIPSFRQIQSNLKIFLPGNLKMLACLVPSFLKLPFFLFDIFYSKF